MLDRGKVFPSHPSSQRPRIETLNQEDLLCEEELKLSVCVRLRKTQKCL